MSINQLFSSSGAVYIGTVRAVETPCPDRKPPCTRVAFTDVELIAGALPEREFTFALPEGLLEDGTIFKIAGAPTFHVGQRYLVFVRAGDWFNTPVTNWFHSIFREVQLPGGKSPAFFINPEGRAVLEVDETGFRLGERLAPPEGALSEGSTGGVRAQPGLSLSSGPPLSDAVRELLAGRANLARFALPKDDLLQRLRALARTYGIQADVPVRLEPAASPLRGRQATSVEQGLDKAATEPGIRRYKEDGRPPVESDIPAEPPVQRQSNPGQSLGD
jgi:hypothetical protein